jgi:predicted Ser/Thr protein kinase
MPADWDDLTALFHAALEQPASERERFLDEACAGDPALRAEAASLLMSHEQAGDFLQKPAVEIAAALAAGDQESSLDGTELGPYKIKRHLGRGGMGRVYLAEDTRLGRDVAIKMLPPGEALDERRRERLRIEARAAATLAHPGIAIVYALEEIGGRLFLVHEYVPGRTLRDEAAGGPLPPRTVVALGVEMARALSAAHAKGIVHRDLKPDNVILSEVGAAKILDFGIARIEGPAGEARKRLTETGAILGTPAYMSPEQIDGKVADFRSDIFSFGVLLYELASGTQPFEAATPLSTAARVMNADPPLLSALNPLVPTELDRIVRRCLRKVPAERYQATRDLAEDLERLHQSYGPGSNQPAGPRVVSASSPRRWRRPRAFWQLHQLGVMLAYAVMTYPAWRARQWTGAVWAVAPFVLFVVAAVLNGTLRVHLLFTAAFNQGALRSELDRGVPWIARSDLVVGAMLVVAAVPIVAAHTSLATLLAAVGIGIMVVSSMIEPATREAAFPRRTMGSGRALAARS